MSKGSHNPHTPVKRPAVTEQQLERVTRSVRGHIKAWRWAKKYPWIGGEEEIGQDAALAALETAASGALQPGLNATAYLYRAALRDAVLRMQRRIAVVSISEAAAAAQTGRTQRRVELSPRLQGEGRPDAHRRAQDAARLWVELAGRIAAHSAILGQRERQAVGLIMGADGAESVDVHEAAWRTGLTPAAVTRALTKIAKPVKDDPEAQRLRRAILDSQGES